MRRYFGLKVWSILVLVLLSGWIEQSVEAQLFRGRRQRCCCCQCCPTRCEPCCCEPKAGARICIIDYLYGYTGYHVYYAHHHENGEECPEYSGFILETSGYHDPLGLPQVCWEGCDPMMYRVGTLPGLPSRVTATEDLKLRMPESKASKVEELAGNLILPDMTTMHVRLQILQVKAKVKVKNGATPTEVSEYFGFGFESESTGKQEFPVRKLVKHKVGATEQENLYEFSIGTTKCVIVTVKRP